jgi:cytochrome c oxidase subunit 3
VSVQPTWTGASASGRGLDPARLGLWIFLATVTMLFAAFSSAYLVRMASGTWCTVELPRAMTWSTAAILLSSVTIEIARRRAGGSVARWLGLTLALGLGFLAWQVMSWRALRAAGVLLPESPHAAFFYVFTALHGLHLAGGLVWLAAVGRTAAVTGRAPAASGEAALRDRLARCAQYWHFMAGLWIYLFVVLHLG